MTAFEDFRFSPSQVINPVFERIRNDTYQQAEEEYTAKSNEEHNDSETPAGIIAHGPWV